MREAWTDERLDDLNGRVERGFDRVDADIRELRGEMNGRFDAVEARLNTVDARFDSMHRTMVIGFVSMAASVIAAVIGVGL